MQSDQKSSVSNIRVGVSIWMVPTLLVRRKLLRNNSGITFTFGVARLPVFLPGVGTTDFVLRILRLIIINKQAFLTFRKKLKAVPEKTIFAKNSSTFVKKLKNLPTKSQFFLNFFSFVWKFSKNIAPKLIFFTKLKQIFKKLKEFHDKLKEFLKKLKVLPTRVGLACGKMSKKKPAITQSWFASCVSFSSFVLVFNRLACHTWKVSYQSL